MTIRAKHDLNHFNETPISGPLPFIAMSYTFSHNYSFDPRYSRAVAYFCMEFAIHQPLKLYAGGLGFLAGSHMRSAYELKQNVVGIGILWKFGYYDQVRRGDQTMDVLFQEKVYGFLIETNIKFTIKISGHDVWVTAFYLDPKVFNTAPLFLLSTDLPENDYLSKTICHRLYDPNPQTKIAGSILLGAGGAKLLEHLHWQPEIYHLNESHALPLAFYLYNRYKDIDVVRNKLVFTNHTPEEGGNPKNDIFLLERMGYFCEVPMTEVKALTKPTGDVMDHTLSALRIAGVCNGVSKMHKTTLEGIWSRHADLCPLLSITNAQNFRYWKNATMYQALNTNKDKLLTEEKKRCKHLLFEIVADQNGEIFDPNILTIVFAKRFAGYKRPDLILQDMERFERLINNKERPVQVIWAGKPYPMDYEAIATFDRIVNICKAYTNCATIVGYEMTMSKILKQGADIWLNNPRITHEASGTSGMSAAMNGAINLGIPDGWFPEFAKHEENSFVIHPCDPLVSDSIQDEADAGNLYNTLEKEVIPMYYDYPLRWLSIIKQSMRDVQYEYDSNRMADEYYRRMYKGEPEKRK